MKKSNDAEVQKEFIQIQQKSSFSKIFTSFIVGILCGILILTLMTAHVYKKSFLNALKSFVQVEESVENHDLTLENHGIAGYVVADFADAILGEKKQLKKLEVYSVDVSDVATLTKAGLGKIKALSKYQYITYNGTAVYTVDLSALNEDSFSLDEESKTLTITVPEPVLEPINIPSEDIEFGEVKRNSILAIGDIETSVEEQNEVETKAKEKMKEKLEKDNTMEEARKAAEHALWDLFHPQVSKVSPEYSLEIAFE